MADINPITNVANAYTLQPYKLPEHLKLHHELNLLFTVKAIVWLQGGRMYYRLYRCGWEGTPNSSSSPNEQGVPQGEQIRGEALEIEEWAKKLFPVLHSSGAVPDPHEYGVIRDGRDKRPIE